MREVKEKVRGEGKDKEVRASCKSAVVCDCSAGATLATRINRLEPVFEMQRLRTTRLACSVYTQDAAQRTRQPIH